jgi:hypothetical protein
VCKYRSLGNNISFRLFSLSLSLSLLRRLSRKANHIRVAFTRQRTLAMWVRKIVSGSVERGATFFRAQLSPAPGSLKLGGTTRVTRSIHLQHVSSMPLRLSSCEAGGSAASCKENVAQLQLGAWDDRGYAISRARQWRALMLRVKRHWNDWRILSVTRPLSIHELRVPAILISRDQLSLIAETLVVSAIWIRRQDCVPI